MTTKIPLSQTEISKFCVKWHVKRLALFGSVLTEFFNAESDVDVLVDFDAESNPTLFEFVRMKNELSGIFNREVDLISREGINRSFNSIRKSAILGSAEVIYGA